MKNMAQPSVASFFNTRKRAAGVDDVSNLKNKRINDATSIPYTTASPTSISNSFENVCKKVIQNHDDFSKAGIRTRSGRTGKRSGGILLFPTDVAPKKLSKSVPCNSNQSKTLNNNNYDKQQTLLMPFISKQKKSSKNEDKTDVDADAHCNSKDDDNIANDNGYLKSSESESNSKKLNELQRINEETPSTGKAANLKSNESRVMQLLKTPTKQIIRNPEDNSASKITKPAEIRNLVRKELNFDEVKMKVSRSAKLQELKASLNRIQDLEKKRKEQEEKNQRLRDGLPPKVTPTIQLKEFDTIELEVLTSPAKTYKTPTKLIPTTPDKNELMSPRHTNVSKRVLFSPSKDGSPSKMILPPAYQRYMSLVQTSRAGQLQLPFKYRHLIEIFKSVDAMCAMFHNRKECITFKKLKPAVQRMLRKNFTEKHLAQIKRIYPEAFVFSQMKTRNYGSTSKSDYFQLIIAPNVVESETMPATTANNLRGGNGVDKQKQMQMQDIDEDNVMDLAQGKIMNPHLMTERLQRFQNLLLEHVKTEHEAFLKTLDPPLSIPREKVMRWHPDFDLENCSDIECGYLPQPPSVEKYSSAHDILSTARNLFNCATPIEKALERYEAKMQAERLLIENSRNRLLEQPATKPAAATKTATTSREAETKTPITTTTTCVSDNITAATASSDATASLLKGLPKSLIEKIRAKQAAKALDAMSRRPSQDRETIKYSRLPDLARHLRNVFITEKKGVLNLEIIIKKIQNSFRTCLTAQEVEEHLRLMEKVVPKWVSFREVRKSMYLKMSKDMDLAEVIKMLEEAANEKSK